MSATDLARVLGKLPEIGKFEKKKDYFENDNMIVASAVGHLVGLKMPTKADGKKLPWSMNHLPHIPSEFELEPIEKSESRFKLLVRLLKRKEVDTVVNACDAGREGELIFPLSAADGKPEKRPESQTNVVAVDDRQRHQGGLEQPAGWT